MTSWQDDFQARVNFAARVISEGRATTRKFDSTCENNDGDAVVAALIRRAEKNERLRNNLFRYIAKDSALEAHEKYKGQNLVEVAARMRADAAAADHPQGDAIRKLATQLWDDDGCTVDHDAALAEACEDGAVWVQCWQLLDADTLRENGITTEGMANADCGASLG